MGRFGAPYDSTVGVPEATMWIALIIILYIVLRVRWQLWYDKKHGVKNPLLTRRWRLHKSALFFHEDDLRQIELVPKGNIEFIKQQCTQINDFSQENSDGSSYKDVFVRDEHLIELNNTKIPPFELEKLLSKYKFRQAAEVFTGCDPAYATLAPNTVGFGDDNACIYYRYQDYVVNAIWLTEPWEMNRESLILFLNDAGLKWNLLLVDWSQTTFVDLSDKQAIINYLNQ